MSKKSKTTTAQTQSGTESKSIDPAVMNLALGNYAKADGVAKGLNGFTGERVAGLNADQLAGHDAMRKIARTPSAGFDTAIGAARDLTSFQPAKVASQGYDPSLTTASQISRADVRDVSAGQIKGQDLSGYMNPHEDNAVQVALNDLERSRQMQRANDSQRAQSRGAFGGDRHGVVDALTNEASLRQASGLAAQMRLAGYDRATGLAAADLDRRLSADQANQGIDFNVVDRNAAMSQQAGLANADAQTQSSAFAASQRLVADQANQQAELAGAGVRNSAAGLLGGLTQNQIQDQIARAGLLTSVGDAQQANRQAGLDAAYQEFVRQQEASVTGQNLMNASLGLVPIPTTNTTSSTMNSVTKTKDPGAMISDAVKFATAVVAASDARVKADVETVGFDASGRRWVDFRYLWDEPGTKRRGLIAQEVLQTDPHAVAHGPGGVLMVDYSKIGGQDGQHERRSDGAS